MLGLVPFVGGQADGLAFFAALDLNSADAVDRVAIAGLQVGWAKAADVKTDF